MAWFKVDDGFANSKPVLRIPRRYRAQAVGMWLLAGTWSAKELTDGFIPDYVLEDVGGTRPMATQLVRAGLWEIADGGWQFIGWTKYQPSKDEVLARRAAEAEKKQRARDAARKAADQRRSESVPGGYPRDNAGSPEGVPGGVPSTRPDPTRPDPAPIQVVTKGGGVTSVDACEAPPPKCSRHKENSDVPCAACRKRRLWDERQAQLLTQDELETKRRAREQAEQCGICRGTNWVPDTEPAVRCEHQAAAHA